MQPFDSRIKYFDLLLNISFPAAFAVLGDMVQDLDNLSREDHALLDYLSLKLDVYQYNDSKLNMVEVLNNLQEMEIIDQKLKISILLIYLFEAEKTFDPNTIELVRSVITTSFSEFTNLTESQRNQIQLQLKMSRIREDIYSIGTVKYATSKELKELCQYFLDNGYYDLFYEEIGKLMNRTYSRDKFVATVIEVLEDTIPKLNDEVMVVMSFYQSLLYKHYTDYNDKSWIKKMKKTLSHYQELNLEDRIETFLMRYYLKDYYDFNFQAQSVKEIEDMLEFATKLELRHYIAEFHLILGDTYMNVENYIQAEYYLSTGIAIREKYGSVGAYHYEQLREVKQHLNKQPEVTTILKKSIDIKMTPPFNFYCGNEKSWLDSSIVTNLNELINIYVEMENFDEAINYLENLVRQEYATDFNTVKSKALILLAQLLLKSEKIPQAIESTKRSTELAKDMGYTIQIIRSLNHTAILYDRYGDIEQALNYWKEAFLRYQDWIINNSPLTEIIQNIDLFVKNESILDLDYIYHSHILENTEKSKEPDLYIKSMANIAIINQIKGNWQSAIELWNDVYQLCILHDVKCYDVISLIRLAEIHHIKGDMVEFVNYYRQAGNTLSNEIDSLRDLGWMYRSSDFIYSPIGKLTLLPEDSFHLKLPNQDTAKYTYGNFLTEGRVLLMRFELKKAEERLMQSISSDSNANKLYSYYLLSMLKIRKGELVEAHKFHDHGMSLLRKGSIKDLLKISKLFSNILTMIFGWTDYETERKNELVIEYKKLKHRIDLMKSNS